MSLKFLREMANRSLPGENPSRSRPKKAKSSSLKQKTGPNKESSKDQKSMIASSAAELECPICMEGMHMPVRTHTCGHKFCFYCVVCLDKCPICRQALDQANGDFLVDEYLNLSLGIHYHPRTLRDREEYFIKQGYAPVETVLQRRRGSYPDKGTVMPSEKMFLHNTAYATATAPKSHLMFSSGGMMKRRAPSLISASNHTAQSKKGKPLNGSDQYLPFLVDSPRHALPQDSNDQYDTSPDRTSRSQRRVVPEDDDDMFFNRTRNAMKLQSRNKDVKELNYSCPSLGEPLIVKESRTNSKRLNKSLRLARGSSHYKETDTLLDQLLPRL